MCAGELITHFGYNSRQHSSQDNSSGTADGLIVADWDSCRISATESHKVHQRGLGQTDEVPGCHGGGKQMLYLLFSRNNVSRRQTEVLTSQCCNGSCTLKTIAIVVEIR